MQPILAILDRHGLTADATKDVKRTFDPKEQEKQEEKLAAMIKGPPGLWVELKTAFKKVPDLTSDGPSSELAGKVENIKIDGDMASGTVVPADARPGAAPQPIVFVKVGGEWRFAPDLTRR